MARLGPRQTLTIYALVLTWSVLVFWAGFTFGIRTPEGDQRAAKESGTAAADSPLPYPSTPSASFASAREAVPEGPGPTAEVQEVDVQEMDAVPVAAPAPEEALSHTVQIAAVRTEAEGQELLARLRRAGHQGKIVPPAGSGVLYRVWVGEFASETAAEEMEETLKSAGFSTYVRQIVDFAARSPR